MTVFPCSWRKERIHTSRDDTNSRNPPPLPAPNRIPTPLSAPLSYYRALLVVSSVFAQPAVSNRAAFRQERRFRRRSPRFVPAFDAHPASPTSPRFATRAGADSGSVEPELPRKRKNVCTGRERTGARCGARRESFSPPLGPGGPAETEMHVDG